jgi:hypothetical protein
VFWVPIAIPTLDTSSASILTPLYMPEGERSNRFLHRRSCYSNMRDRFRKPLDELQCLSSAENADAVSFANLLGSDRELDYLRDRNG